MVVLLEYIFIDNAPASYFLRNLKQSIIINEAQY